MRNGFTGKTPVVVVGLGGTIMSRRMDAEHGQVIAPDSTLRYLVEQAHEEMDAADRTMLSELHMVQAKRRIDSSDLTLHGLERTLRHLAKIRDHYQARLVVLFGTDNMALMAEATRQALPASPHPIIFTCAQRDIDHPDSDAVANVRDAISLALQPEAVAGNRGVIGVQFDGVLRPAFGFIKKTTDMENPFSSRGARIAEWCHDGRQWKFPRPPWPPYFFGSGTTNDPKLPRRIKDLRVTPGFDYDEFLYDVTQTVRRPVDKRTQMIILEAPGPGNLSSEEPKREALRKATTLLHQQGIPLVVLPQACAMQQTVDAQFFEREPVYAGNPVTLSPDDLTKNPLYLPDVTANEGLACAALALGETLGRPPKELIAHMRRRLADYTFLVSGVTERDLVDHDGKVRSRSTAIQVGDPLAFDTDSDEHPLHPEPKSVGQKLVRGVTRLLQWRRPEREG